MLKRFITSLVCLIFIFVSIPIFGLTKSFCVPVYADSNFPSGYESANTDEDLVQSFSDYVKSRNANFTGSLPDAVDLYILNKMRLGSESLNSDLDTIKSNLAKKTDAGGNIIWYLDSTVTNFYNSLFDFLLRDLDLSVGDENVNQNLYTGQYFVGNDGTACLLFIVSSRKNFSNYLYDNYKSQFSQIGTQYKISGKQFYDNVNADSSYQLNVYYLNRFTSFPRYSLTNNNYCSSFLSYTSSAYSNTVYYGVSDSTNYSNIYGFPCIAYNTSSNEYYLSVSSYRVQHYNNNGSVNGNSYYNFYMPTTGISSSLISDNVSNCTINIVSQEINNNTYEGDTYITNEGDIVNPPVDTPPGGNDPGWDVNGGQGSSGDTIINFPDFELPDLNIDWSINGLGNKFPFSIPFDIAALVTVLNAEPEAPRFQGTMDLGITTYEYDINLAQFDSVASACRIAELLLLVFGLIMITRSIIKG